MEWRTEDVFLERKKDQASQYMQKKQTMHQIMLRDLKFLRYWWSCLACVTFCWFALHETLILLSCCVFIEMVDCLNTIILKSFVIIVFTSILHLFYRTNTTQNMYQTLFFYIKRILDPNSSDVMYNVTLFTWQYAPNTRN
jgi:hypothetical protein